MEGDILKEFYKVRVFEKELVDYQYNIISDSKYIGNIIVSKKKSKAKEVITGLSLEVLKENSDVVPNIYKQDLFGRELYVKDIDFISDNIVSIFDVYKYIDSYDNKTFCLQNRINKRKQFNLVRKLAKE